MLHPPLIYILIDHLILSGHVIQDIIFLFHVRCQQQWLIQSSGSGTSIKCSSWSRYSRSVSDENSGLCAYLNTHSSDTQTTWWHQYESLDTCQHNTFFAEVSFLF